MYGKIVMIKNTEAKINSFLKVFSFFIRYITPPIKISDTKVDKYRITVSTGAG